MFEYNKSKLQKWKISLRLVNGLYKRLKEIIQIDIYKDEWQLKHIF